MRSFISIIFIFVCICLYQSVFGQVNMGYYSTDNTINTVKDNPAFALTTDRVQINFFDAGVAVGGNSILFRRSAYSFLTTGIIAPGTDYIKNTTADPRYMSLNMELTTPGVSFTFKKKYAFAITSGIRYLANTDNLDHTVFMGLGTNAVPLSDSITHNSFAIKNYNYSAQLFKELNLSGAANILDMDDFSLVGGATLKLLLGVGAMGFGVPQASFNTKNNDGIAYNLTGNANFATTPYSNTFALTNSPMNAFQNTTNNLGVGFDIGSVFYLHVNNSYYATKGYQIRLAASITDIGGISYTASSTSGSYSINNKNIDYKNIQNNASQSFGNRIFNEYLLDTIVKGIGSVSKFRVGLPTAFHLNADANIIDEHFYLNCNLLLNLRSPTADKYANHYISTFTLTPRYMINNYAEIGFAMPFTFSFLNQGSLGAVAFVGPFYIGSGSFFNTFITNTFKNIDLFTGFALRIKSKRQKEKDYMMM